MADSAGNTYVAGLLQDFIATDPFGGHRTVTYANLSGIAADGKRVMFSTRLAGANVQSIVLDAQGDLYAAAGSGISKLAPDGSVIVSTSISAQALALAVDSAGFLYATGFAGPDFQPTAGALKSRLEDTRCSDPQTGGATFCGDAFVVKLTPDLAVVYATYLGGAGHDRGSSIAVGADGSVYVAGNTQSADFPVSTNAFQAQYAGGSSGPGTAGDAFFAHLDPTGSRILYATYLGGSHADEAGAILLDNDRNVYVAGTTWSGDFPVTGSAQSVEFSGEAGGSDAFFVKFDASGSAVYSSFSGLDGGGVGGGAALGSDGRWYFAVFRPRLAKLGFIVCDPRITTLLAIDASRGRIVDQAAVLGIGSAADVSIDAAGIVHLVGDGTSAGQFAAVPRATPAAAAKSGFLAGIDFSRRDEFIPACMVNAAAGWLNRDTHAAPGEIISIFGLGLGPSQGVSAVPIPAYPRELEGTRVRLGGALLPLLYVSDTQINAVVPYGAPLGPATLTIERGSYQASYQAEIVANHAALFTADGSGSGQVAALNQDGSVNSPDHPAPWGSIVSLFATGLGTLSSPLPEDLPTPLAPPWPPPVQTYQVTLPKNSQAPPPEITYIGPAPGLAPGIYQINVRILPFSGLASTQIALSLLDGQLVPTFLSLRGPVENR